jgi:hypothetical protein
MRKIFDTLEKLVPSDKLAHFFYFTLLAFLSAFAYYEIICIPKWVIIAPCAFIAVSKELFDKFVKRTTFDIVDILFSVASSIILYLLL